MEEPVEARPSGPDRAVLPGDADRPAGWLNERGLMLRPSDVPPVAVIGFTERVALASVVRNASAVIPLVER